MKIRHIIMISASLMFYINCADGFELVASNKLPSLDIPGKDFSILGISFGMNKNQVVDIIDKEYHEQPEVKEGSIGVQYKTLSGEFGTLISDFHVCDRDLSRDTNVYFTSPVLGSVVESVEHHIVFSDGLTAPKVASVLQQLQDKYGEISYSSLEKGAIQNDSHEIYSVWARDGLGKNVRCKRQNLENIASVAARCPSYTPNPQHEYNSGIVETYDGDFDKKIQYWLQATIKKNDGDSERVSVIWLSLINIKLIKDNSRETVSQINSVMEKAFTDASSKEVKAKF